MTRDIREAAWAVVRKHYHVHADRCYGPYEPCGEHHAHSDTCGGRPLRCGKKPSDKTINRLAELLNDEDEA
jgi:hypothetical protein